MIPLRHFLALALATTCVSQLVNADSRPLWSDLTPDALGDTPNDIPTLTAYLPPTGKANGASMLILPGGGYGALADHEGKAYADWFVANGITCYVLKYRLGSHGYRHPVELNDAARALRTVRSLARHDGLDPERVGIIGSSAGGHLASTLLTHFDAGNANATDLIERESSRPDLGILCYPVISMGEFTHQGSKNNLLGASPSPELVKNLSNELQVTPQTPPCFLWHTDADKAVAVENSLLFAAALRRNNVPFSLHIYEKGGHGQGMKKGAPPWVDQCLYWLGERKFLKAH